MPALDRLVTLDMPIQVTTPAAGVTGAVIAGWAIARDVQSGSFSPGSVPSSDVYVVATNAQGSTVVAAGAVAGKWRAGSRIHWTSPAPDLDPVSAELLRDIDWADTSRQEISWSLRYGIRYHAPSVRTGPTGHRVVTSTYPPGTNTAVNPTVTDPAWNELDTSITGAALNTTSVLTDGPEGQVKAWAQLVTEQYFDQRSDDGLLVQGGATWRLRAGPRIVPFGTLRDGAETWKVTAVRRVGTGRRWVEIDTVRDYAE